MLEVSMIENTVWINSWALTKPLLKHLLKFLLQHLFLRSHWLTPLLKRPLSNIKTLSCCILPRKVSNKLDGNPPAPPFLLFDTIWSDVTIILMIIYFTEKPFQFQTLFDLWVILRCGSQPQDDRHRIARFFANNRSNQRSAFWMAWLKGRTNFEAFSDSD